eukprot:TRINITY_DN4688_c0_g1_i1.p1 TRINITY_DN4688_c0_g1~~TRINITY_DN4688_c0_g1_i1.p1  ORF type:complete len:882 (-),score=203.70 TRINITY_DN4688_c0_g1_i1:19-2310(-)
METHVIGAHFLDGGLLILSTAGCTLWSEIFTNPSRRDIPLPTTCESIRYSFSVASEAFMSCGTQIFVFESQENKWNPIQLKTESPGNCELGCFWNGDFEEAFLHFRNSDSVYRFRRTSPHEAVFEESGNRLSSSIDGVACWKTQDRFHMVSSDSSLMSFTIHEGWQPRSNDSMTSSSTSSSNTTQSPQTQTPQTFSGPMTSSTSASPISSTTSMGDDSTQNQNLYSSSSRSDSTTSLDGPTQSTSNSDAQSTSTMPAGFCDQYAQMGWTCDGSGQVSTDDNTMDETMSMPMGSNVTIMGNMTFSKESRLVYDIDLKDLDNMGHMSIAGEFHPAGKLMLYIDDILTKRFQLENQLENNRTFWLIDCAKVVGDFSSVFSQVSSANDTAFITTSTSQVEMTSDTRQRYGVNVQLRRVMQDDLISPSPSIKAGSIVGIVLGTVVGLSIIVLLLALILFKTMEKKRSLQIEELRELSENKFYLTDLTVQEKIGEGSFGEVYKGVLMGVAVACKKVKSDEWESFAREIQMLTRLTHPNIVQYLGTCMQDEHRYIVMELMSGGSLSSLVQHEKLDFQTQLDIIVQCARGMVCLVDNHVLHRDLALRNVLIVRADVSSFVAKLADFGMARTLPTDAQHISSATEKIPLRWAAIEVIEKGSFSEKSDVWAFGCMLWELFMEGQFPYSDQTNEDAIVGVLNGTRLIPPPHLPEELQKLMSSCWRTNPSHRPKFSLILESLQDMQDSVKPRLIVHPQSDALGSEEDVYHIDGVV